MIQRHSSHYNEDDYFADTRMTFGEHIEDLRTHLLRALYGLGIFLFIGFILDAIGSAADLPIGVGKPMVNVIARPVEVALQNFYDRRVERVREQLKNGANAELAEDNQPRDMMVDIDVAAWRKALGLPPLENEPGRIAQAPVRIRPVEFALELNAAHKHIGRRPALTTLSIQEAVLVYIKVSFLCGFVLASPWVFWQVWSFIAAGLYPHEKRYVHVYLPFSLGLFLIGVLVCQFIVMPQAVKALLWFNEWIGLEPDLRLNEWLGFAIIMPLVFGVSFQTPLVMLFLERLGIFDIDTYRNNRKIAWFLMACFAAIVTPTIDVSGMLLLWLPMGLLYELGIYLIKLSPRSQLGIDVPDADEMIEV